MLKSGGTGWNHICVIARAVRMFSSKLRTYKGKGTCSSSLDNKFENCTDETASGRLWATDTGAYIKQKHSEKVYMRTATLDKICQVSDIPFTTLTYVAVEFVMSTEERII
jgi:hypothetical protein